MNFSFRGFGGPGNSWSEQKQDNEKNKLSDKSISQGPLQHSELEPQVTTRKNLFKVIQNKSYSRISC